MPDEAEEARAAEYRAQEERRCAALRARLEALRGSDAAREGLRERTEAAGRTLTASGLTTCPEECSELLP